MSIIYINSKGDLVVDDFEVYIKRDSMIYNIAEAAL